MTDVHLSGQGPFELPKMRSVLSFGEGTRDTPVLRLGTERGEEVWIPIPADQVWALSQFAQAWLALPQNPLNTKKP